MLNEALTFALQECLIGFKIVTCTSYPLSERQRTQACTPSDFVEERAPVMNVLFPMLRDEIGEDLTDTTMGLVGVRSYCISKARSRPELLGA